MVSIGRTTLLVHDLDAAKAFYLDAFRLRGMGGFRTRRRA